MSTDSATPTGYPKAQVRAAFESAFVRGARSRRHRADVTADRLADDMAKWHELFDGRDFDDASRIIHILRGIAGDG